MSAVATTILPSERLNAYLLVMQGYGVTPRVVWLSPLAYDELLAEMVEFFGGELPKNFEMRCNGAYVLRKVVH